MVNKVLITGGTGLIGSRLTELLLERGYSVAHLSRKKQKKSSVPVYQYDTAKGYIEDGALEGMAYLIHLAGAGIADERWTEERKKVIISSRTEPINLITSKLREKQIFPRAFISASGSAFYGGDTGDRKHTEDCPPGNDFLAEVSVLWENAADQVRELGVRTVKLRTGVVLSKKGGALPKITLPIRFGLGAPLGPGTQWMSWIHIDDLCRMYIEAMENDSWEGAYNAVSAPPTTNRQVTIAISRILQKPQWLPPVPAFALRLIFGEMAGVVLGSNYVENYRIETETNFIYEFPQLTNALENIFKP
ncbi:Epimerase family protein [Dyadobacter sp. CECT 9275]|uniref:Epimerase family protein n=1 Tax=Dyadobacter helix TaxID=2822344 RepID=A0A916NEA1_9BACT|nr:TIGR01777 family oxidoreductase [Dyadobacter sp. CECT 9275]CAG5012882.1 Epimerase family protein [Dyadobacter sp. CECT 9275]